MAALGRDHYAGVKKKTGKSQGCHRQLTIKAGDQLEEGTVKAVSTAERTFKTVKLE